MSDPLGIVEVSITGTSQTPAVAGFGTGLILSKHTRFSGIRTYTGLAGVAADGFVARSPTYLIAQAYFAQNPRPARLKIANNVSSVAWTARFDVTSVPAVGTVVEVKLYTWDSVLRTGTYTVLTGDAATDIAAGLHASLDALTGVSTSFTLTNEYFTMTAESGSGRKLQVVSLHPCVSYRDTEAGSDYDTRLSELALVDPDFYGVMIDSTSGANIEAVATWCATAQRVFFAVTQDTREKTSGAVLLPALMAAGHKRVDARYKERGERSDGAMAGVILSRTWDSGTAPTWAFRELLTIGVDPLTPTEVTAVLANNGSVYVADRGGRITWEGKTPSGTYGDLTVFLDWLDARIGESVFGLLLRELRLAYTSEDIQKAQDAVWDVLRVAIERKAVSLDFPVELTAPAPGDATTSERENRTLGGGGIRFSFVFSGGIHKVQVNGVVTL